jgi:hypothetical protein
VLVVASSCTVTVFAPLALDDVITGISGFTVVDDAFMDRGRLIPLGVLGMNRGLSLLSEGLGRLLQGKPASPRGGTFGLLHGSGFEESSDFIAGPIGLEVRWLRHVTKEHGGFDCPILDNATIDVVSSLSSSSAMCVCRALLLKGLLK